MPKPNKENIITDILIELEKGSERSECMAIVGNKWQTSIRTFDRYWKEGNQRHLINQQATQKALAEQSTTSELERLKKAILTKDEALEILTIIISSEYEKTNEKILAVKTMADLQGWKAPIKTELSGEIKTTPSAINVRIIESNDEE